MGRSDIAVLHKDPCRIEGRGIMVRFIHYGLGSVPIL